MRTPHDRQPEWMFVLTAYVDESGFGAKDVIVVGGFLGNDKQWDSFAKDWKIGLGKRKALHMKDLYWKHKRTRLLLQRLGPIPSEHDLVPVWVKIRVCDYADLVDDTIFSRKLNHGYMLGAQTLAIVLLMYVWELDERIKLVFEHNDQFAEFVPLFLDVMSKLTGFKTSDGLPCLSGVEFVPKDGSSLTQPADYLTYATLQSIRNPDSVRAQWSSPILRNVPSIVPQLSRDEIRTLLSRPSHKELQKIGRELEPLLRSINMRRWLK